MNRPAQGWTGTAGRSWEVDDRHSFALLFIRRPGVIGKGLVIFDVDAMTPAEAATANKP